MMSQNCPNVAIRNQKVRIVTSDGDIYFGNSAEEAKKVFENLKSKQKKVDGHSAEPTHVLYINREIVDMF